MKKLIFLLALTMSTSFAWSASQDYSPAHAAVLSQFKNGKENTAKDAIWSAQDIFKVGVVPDGTNRDGYASYACEVLYDHGFKGKAIWVQVIDIVALKRTGKWNKIGEAHCK